MKRTIIYISTICFILIFAACEDNIEDATSKHVYGENESPYLRTDLEATIAFDQEFEVGRFEDLIINLDDYNSVFQHEMNMTVDQVISGLNSGDVVFYNINTTRGIWDKAAMTKGSTGWYYNTAGGVCSEGDAAQVASLDINTGAKTLVVNMKEGTSAGTLLSFNVGFAIKGPDYDSYVRFSFNLSVTDPSLIITTVSIPAGDYSSAPIDFTQHADVIEYNMGMDVDDFLAKLDVNEGGTIRMYVIDTETDVWDETSGYTANPPGYWMNGSGDVCSWGDTGFSLYAETNIGDKTLYVGRAPELATGTTFTIGIGYKDTSDETKFFRFIITATLE